MKYYEMHELVYQDLESKDYISWDKDKEVKLLLSSSINKALEPGVEAYFPNTSAKRALDIGTGTGVVALNLAKKGFDSHGLDISETAIKLAKQNAKDLGIQASFKTGDLNLIEGSDQYDLIVDSSCLHCIVEEFERKRLLEKLKRLLRKDGKFFVQTMVTSVDMSKMLNASHLFMKGEVLYSLGPDHWEMEWVNVDGKRAFPHRRIKSRKNLLLELEAAGLRELKTKVVKNDGHPDLFVGWFE